MHLRVHVFERFVMVQFILSMVPLSLFCARARDKLGRNMDEISENLLDMNVPLEEIEDIVFEGYRGLNRFFKMLWRSPEESSP